uniref:Peptidase_M16_C domain-containing protein n=1 Tax=Meloidogyne hapla TaxID=6305 RepID=A0A1I8BWY8_MELHA
MMRLFNKIAKVSIHGNVDVTVYRSTRSKLRVAVANVPGPMVKGKISFGLASGTNAVTDQDHTGYTLTTAGNTGFLKTLPIFMDHLLSPLLTNSQYLTEVHHVDGKGADSGVVYSEMQDLESDMERMVDRRRKELFYPPDSSYAASSGGQLKEIREMCSAERVRRYHNLFYHLNNMFITVSGFINHEALLDAIAHVEEPNIPLIPKNFNRPFSSRTPAIQRKDDEVICPADDDSIGLVEISWLGPKGSDVYKNRALLLLFDYLTDTSGAPLKRDFVQIDDPFCSSVSISLIEQTDCEIVASFDDVPTTKLNQIRDRFFSKTVVDHSNIDTFDMERLRFMIDQQMRSFRLKMENSPHSFIADAIIGHQLYGPSDENEQQKDLEERLQELQILKKLRDEPAEFWHSLFTETFKQNCICVIGKPSIEAVDELMEKEKARLDAQIKRLGKEGLQEKAKILSDAVAENKANQPTSEVLKDLIVKDLESFRLIPVSSQVLEGWPIHTTWHEITSDFYESSTLIDTNKIPSNLRKYMMLWAELLFQSGATIDNKNLTYDEVAKLVTRDLVSSSVSMGISGVYSRFVTLQLRVDGNNYHKLAEWTHVFLKQLIPAPQRVLICAKKLANNAAEYKRDGNSMAHFLSSSMVYDKNSNDFMFGYLSNEKFHRAIASSMENGKIDLIMQCLKDLNDAILSALLNVHLVGNMQNLPKDERNGNAWTFLKNQDVLIEQQKCDPTDGQSWTRLGEVNAISVGGSESSFLLRKAKFSDNWTGASTISTLLLSQYICQSEGPLWNSVRGNGLAYDASIYVLPDRKTITLSLYRCSKLTQAYEKTRETVLSILDGGLDETEFEAAKRSLVCELVSGQSTIKSTAVSAILAVFRNVNTEFTNYLCSKIWNATKEDVLANGSPAIKDLFDDDKTITAIASNSSRKEEVKKLFPKVRMTKLGDLQLPEN